MFALLVPRAIRFDFVTSPVLSDWLGQLCMAGPMPYRGTHGLPLDNFLTSGLDEPCGHNLQDAFKLCAWTVRSLTWRVSLLCALSQMRLGLTAEARVTAVLGCLYIGIKRGLRR